MSSTTTETEGETAPPLRRDFIPAASRGQKLGHNPVDSSKLRYPQFAPTWEGHEKYPPWEDFVHIDPGTRADPSLKDLFPDGPEKYTNDLTPKFGSEVRGVQLSQLSDKAKDELALFVAERGVAVFRAQDLRDQPIDKILEFSGYFGRNHIHPTYSTPKDHHQIHLVYRGTDNSDQFDSFTENKTTSVGWHSDVSYEKQPPGVTFLAILEHPSSGGDTAFVDTVEAYNRLSPEFQKRIENLRALHSGNEEAQASIRQGGIVRRAPVSNFHPVVRTHPVTKKKALFVNPGFTRYIEGFKLEESRYLLKFLYDHMARSLDFQVRTKWEDGTVVVWDNRRAVHTALVDFTKDHVRHAFRLTPQAEVPF